MAIALTSTTRSVRSLRGRPPPTELAKVSQASPRANRRFRCNQQRSQTTRFQFRGLDDLLCLHAGGGNGKRSPGGLFPLSGFALTEALDSGLSNHDGDSEVRIPRAVALDALSPEYGILYAHSDPRKAAFGQGLLSYTGPQNCVATSNHSAPADGEVGRSATFWFPGSVFGLRTPA